MTLIAHSISINAKNTIREEKNMKTSLALAVTAVVAGMVTSAFPTVSRAEIQVVDSHGEPAVVPCALLPNGKFVYAVHMDKIIFRIVGNLVAPDVGTQTALNSIPKNSRLDIKVLDDPKTIADLKGKVLTFMGAPNSADNRDQIVIDDVDYAVVCRDPLPND
jgi:hypothetical protein